MNGLKLNDVKNTPYLILVACICVLSSGIFLFMVNYYTMKEMSRELYQVENALLDINSEIGRVGLDIKGLDIDITLQNVGLNRLYKDIRLGSARIDSINRVVLSMHLFHQLEDITKVRSLKIIEKEE